MRTDGLSVEDASEIETFAAAIREGLAQATPADRRRLFETLQIHGTVYMDEDGVRIGRKYRFRIEWEAAIQLLDTNRRAPYHRVE